jgi:hypothetical protein
VGIYATAAQCHPDAEVIFPPRSTAVLSDDVKATPTQRDRHLQGIAEHGRISWQKKGPGIISDLWWRLLSVS